MHYYICMYHVRNLILKLFFVIIAFFPDTDQRNLYTEEYECGALGRALRCVQLFHPKARVPHYIVITRVLEGIMSISTNFRKTALEIRESTAAQNVT
jgi:hypothetical protein